VRKPERKRPFARPRHRWKDNIQMDLREIVWRWGGMDWIDLAQDMGRWRTLVNAVMNLRTFIKFPEFREHTTSIS
jgi:hypothetical protein